MLSSSIAVLTAQAQGDSIHVHLAQIEHPCSDMDQVERAVMHLQQHRDVRGHDKTCHVVIQAAKAWALRSGRCSCAGPSAALIGKLLCVACSTRVVASHDDALALMALIRRYPRDATIVGHSCTLVQDLLRANVISAAHAIPALIAALSATSPVQCSTCLQNCVMPILGTLADVADSGLAIVVTARGPHVLVDLVDSIYLPSGEPNLCHARVLGACFNLMAQWAAGHIEAKACFTAADAASVVMGRLRHVASSGSPSEKTWQAGLALLLELAPFATANVHASGFVVRALKLEHDFQTHVLAVKLLVMLAGCSALPKPMQRSVVHGLLVWARRDAGLCNEHRELSLDLVRIAWTSTMDNDASDCAKLLRRHVAVAMFRHRSARAEELAARLLGPRGLAVLLVEALDIHMDRTALFARMAEHARNHSVQLLIDAGLASHWPSNIAKADVDAALDVVACLWPFQAAGAGNDFANVRAFLTRALFQPKFCSPKAHDVLAALECSDAVAKALIAGFDVLNMDCAVICNILAALQTFAQREDGLRRLRLAGLNRHIADLCHHQCAVEGRLLSLVLLTWSVDGALPKPTEAALVEFMARCVYIRKAPAAQDVLQGSASDPFALACCVTALHVDYGAEANNDALQRLFDAGRQGWFDGLVEAGLMDKLPSALPSSPALLDLVAALVRHVEGASLPSRRGLVAFLVREAFVHGSETCRHLLSKLDSRFDRVEADVAEAPAPMLVSMAKCAICQSVMRSPRMYVVASLRAPGPRAGTKP